MGATVALFRKPSGLVSIQACRGAAGLSVRRRKWAIKAGATVIAMAELHCAPSAAQDPAERLQRYNEVRLRSTLTPKKAPESSQDTS